MEHGISKQSVRKYLCEYLSSQDIRSLAPQERNTDRALTQDEKNMRKALNKYYYKCQAQLHLTSQLPHWVQKPVPHLLSAVFDSFDSMTIHSC